MILNACQWARIVADKCAVVVASQNFAFLRYIVQQWWSFAKKTRNDKDLDQLQTRDKSVIGPYNSYLSVTSSMKKKREKKKKKKETRSVVSFHSFIFVTDRDHNFDNGLRKLSPASCTFLRIFPRLVMFSKRVTCLPDDFSFFHGALASDCLHFTNTFVHFEISNARNRLPEKRISSSGRMTCSFRLVYQPR